MSDTTEPMPAETLLNQRSRELAALQAFGLAASISNSFDQISTAALRGMLETVQADLGFLFLREGERLILKEVLPPEMRQRLGIIPEHRVGECICGLTVREDRPLYSRDIHQDFRCTWEECKQAGIRSFAAIPLRNGEGSIGVCGLASLTERDFAAHASFLETLANQVAVALGNVQLYEAARREVAERKRAEAAQARLNAILEKTSDLVATSTPDARLTYLNQAGREMVGWGKDEPLDGLAIADLHPAWAFKKIETAGLPAATETGVWEGETAVLHRDGKEIPVSQVILAHRSPDGDILYFSTIVRNISERKRTETELKESEDKYRRLIETTGTGYVIIDDQGRVIDANPEYAHLTGRQGVEDVIGHSVLEWTAPHDLERNAEEVRKFLAQGFVRNLEIDYLTPTGQFVPVEINATILHAAGTLQILTLCRDISERKLAEETLRRNEERLRSLIDSAPFGAHLYELDELDRLVFSGYNKSADRILGVDNAQFIGKTIEEAFPALTATEIPARYKRVASTSEGFENVQVDYDQGKIRGAFEVHAFQTAHRRMAAFFIDITERKQAEEEKEKLQSQLLQAQKMESVGRLAGGVAHDFNNMLTAILGHAELAITRFSPSEPTYADLKVIIEASLRSAALTRQLLAFARKQTVAPKVLDINDTVAGMLKMMLRLIGEDIDLAWLPGAGLWPVKIDPSQIDQLLANLCVNARDAIAGVGKVTIETENIVFDADYCAVHPGLACGEYVLLAVSDDGCGMGKEVLDRLFEPFFTTKEVGKGTGLGLATVYGIVKQNEGFINVYSEPGKGTTFKIYLRRFVGESLRPTAESTPETFRGRGETVLLVEDEAVILDLGRVMLESLGYTVLTADRPDQALHHAKTHADTIQLLITDVVMPEMNGRDLAKLIDGIKPGIKCLFISGYTANAIAHHGVLDEGVNFLQKPFSMNALASKVRQALE